MEVVEGIEVVSGGMNVSYTLAERGVLKKAGSGELKGESGRDVGVEGKRNMYTSIATRKFFGRGFLDSWGSFLGGSGWRVGETGGEERGWRGGDGDRVGATGGAG